MFQVAAVLFGKSDLRLFQHPLGHIIGTTLEGEPLLTVFEIVATRSRLGLALLEEGV